MNGGPRSRQQGLSLVELLLGLAITALVMAPLLPMLETAHAASRITAERQGLEREASFALARIAARIRATTPSPALSATSTADWFASTVYLVSNGALVERQNGVNRVLADSVTDFQLTAPLVNAGHPVIEVSLTLARSEASTTATATVRMGGLQ